MADQPDKLRLQELASKFLNGKLSKAEQHEFDSWFNKDDKEPVEVPEETAEREDIHANLILSRIHQEIEFTKTPQIIHRAWWPYMAIAASVMVFLSGGAFYFFHHVHPVEIVGNDILPGTNKAILTLSNGQQITLTGNKTGMLSRQAGVRVIKTSSGQITYEDSSATSPLTPVYNTLSTPKGGQYHVVLADGTEAWLNASSSITYPVAFAGKERRVTTTGEVYFEVAHNPAKPFRVSTGNQMVEVLGTHFDIDGYTDERVITTTLLQGSVKIIAPNHNLVIKPGEQASYNGQNLLAAGADAEEAIAWKKGYFSFKNENISDVMKKLSKWYDVEVVYSSGLSNETFTGAISRYKNISEVLAVVAQTGTVKFKVEGRRVTVK